MLLAKLRLETLNYQITPPKLQHIGPGGNNDTSPWTKLILTPIIHAQSDTTRYMVLQVTSLAAFGIYGWFYAGGPFPSRLQCGTSKRNSA
jgi:hypothetical protein